MITVNKTWFLRLLQLFSSLQVFQLIFCMNFPISPIHASRRAHRIVLDMIQRNNIRRKIQIIKLIILQLPTTFPFSSFLPQNYNTVFFRSLNFHECITSEDLFMCSLGSLSCFDIIFTFLFIPNLWNLNKIYWSIRYTKVFRSMKFFSYPRFSLSWVLVFNMKKLASPALVKWEWLWSLFQTKRLRQRALLSSL